MVKKKKRKGNKKKRTKGNKTKTLDIDTIWPSEDKKEEKQVSVVEEPSLPIQEEQKFPENMSQEEINKIKEQQGHLHLKLKRLMLKYDISQKNMDKAAKLWQNARKLPHCDKIPNPAEWVLNFEHLTKYWANLINQAKQYKRMKHKQSTEIPSHFDLVLDEKSEISIYMNYFYKYFVD